MDPRHRPQQSRRPADLSWSRELPSQHGADDATLDTLVNLVLYKAGDLYSAGGYPESYVTCEYSVRRERQPSIGQKRGPDCIAWGKEAVVAQVGGRARIDVCSAKHVCRVQVCASGPGVVMGQQGRYEKVQLTCYRFLPSAYFMLLNHLLYFSLSCSSFIPNCSLISFILRFPCSSKVSGTKLGSLLL